MSPELALDIIRRLESQPAFAALVDEVEATIGPAIRDYTADRATQPEGGAKALKDAVWGMVDLRASEVVLLDSPPFQRLRRVRQLGLTYLTYPTASYSRFEHTIGATHQAERMVQAIARRSEPHLAEAVLNASATVRLATLLHDLGHMPLSHVSERYFTTYECPDQDLARRLEALRTEVMNATSAPHAHLSEVLSMAIASSEAMRDLMTGLARYSDEEIATATLAIVGRPTSLHQTFVSQIVSNIVDADKLDYMFRDAFVTRVPLAVDLERLLYKLKCLDVPADLLSPALREMARAGESAYVLGTDLAGSDFAQDLSLSRAMLYDRIYYHHKTRAAERVALQILGELRYTPVQLLQHDDELFGRYGPAHEVCPKLASKLATRQLPRRCFAMAYGRLVDKAEENSETGKPIQNPAAALAWIRMGERLNDPIARAEITDAIAAMLDRLRPSHTPSRSVELWVDSQPDPHNPNMSELLVEFTDGTLGKGSSFPGNASAFTRNPEALSYVFISGSSEQILLTYIATELVVFERFQLYFGRAAADLAKINIRNVDALKRELEASLPELYDGAGELRPKSHYADTQAARDRLDILAGRFAHYHGVAGVTVDRRRLQRFLDQFPEQLVQPMLTVLEHIQYLDREALGQLVVPLESSLPENAVMVPLTIGTEKSAAHIGYYFEDYEAHRRVTDLHRAVHGDDPIVLYDDCLLSGAQAADVVRGWFGEEVDDPGLAEPLTPEQIERLRRRGVLCRFAYARSDAINRLTTAFADHGIKADVGAQEILDAGGRRLEAILGADKATPLRDFLRRVGEQLLLTTKGTEDPARWPAQKCVERALGYGGLEELVVTLYNTPTATFTALWKGGQYRKVPWLNLFPRRHEEPGR